MRTVAQGLGLLVAAAAFAVQAADVAPDALVKSTVNEVLSVIKQHKDRQTLHDLAEKKVLSHFDFQAMTRIAVGRSWRDANPDQQKRLENAFRGLLVNTYTTALSRNTESDAVVEVKPVQLKPDQDDVTVKTVARQSGRQPVAIDYRMTRTSNGWKVYDVIVENLSLVTNYRGSFSTEISRSGIDGLIKVIEDKNRKLAAS